MLYGSVARVGRAAAEGPARPSASSVRAARQVPCARGASPLGIQRHHANRRMHQPGRGRLVSTFEHHSPRPAGDARSLDHFTPIAFSHSKRVALRSEGGPRRARRAPSAPVAAGGPYRRALDGPAPKAPTPLGWARRARRAPGASDPAGAKALRRPPFGHHPSALAGRGLTGACTSQGAASYFLPLGFTRRALQVMRGR